MVIKAFCFLPYWQCILKLIFMAFQWTAVMLVEGGFLCKSSEGFRLMTPKLLIWAKWPINISFLACIIDDLWYHTNHAAWLKILSFNSRWIFWTLYFLSKVCVCLLQPPWKFHSKTVFAKQFSIMITPPNQKKQNNEIFSVFLVLASQY